LQHLHQQTFDFLRELPCQIRRNAGAKWFEAMNAALSGVRRRPTVRSKAKKRNRYVTSELFRVHLRLEMIGVVQPGGTAARR
jgi:hypothetical protein